jgi:hypothetical protein
MAKKIKIFKLLKRDSTILMNFAILHHRTWKILTETVTLKSTSEVSKRNTVCKQNTVYHRILFFLSAKYEYKKFLDRSALVASKLGLSRSATLGPSRSAFSFPAAAPLARSSAHVTNSQVAVSNASTSSHTAPTLPQGSSRAQLPQPPHPSGGVWDDINSLKGNSQGSSLPLQYDQPTYPPQGNPSMPMPEVMGAMIANVYPVGAYGMGSNPYQPNNEVRLVEPCKYINSHYINSQYIKRIIHNNWVRATSR